jgi:hypothetical protein
MIVWAARQLAAWHARKVQRSMLEPREAQREALERLKALLHGTEAARRSGFDAVKTLDDCRRLPKSDAESVQGALEQVFEGGAAQRGWFGRSKLYGFMRTSGSRGAPKLIPVNRAYLASVDRTLLRMVCSQLFTGGDWGSVFSGRHVFLSSRPRVGASPTGLPIYDASALYPTRASWWVRFCLLPRHADLWLDDWGDKRDRTLEQARGKQVISLNGLPALAIDFARRATEKFGVRHLDALWPRLRQLSYGGVAFSAAQRAELLGTWFSPGHRLAFYETYFASEAPLGFAFDARDDALALNTLENVYLFRRVPGGGELLFAHELEAGGRYALYVTTPGGLVNFHLGDLIEVVSVAPLLVRVAGREGEELSMTGEKITLAQVDLALGAVGLGPQRLGVHLPLVWKAGGERQRLVWGLPDVAPQVAASDLPGRLDEALCALNLLYAEALQREHVVDGCEVVRVPAAVFERHRQARLGNYKPKRLFESRSAVEAEYGALQ